MRNQLWKAAPVCLLVIFATEALAQVRTEGGFGRLSEEQRQASDPSLSANQRRSPSQRFTVTTTPDGQFALDPSPLMNRLAQFDEPEVIERPVPDFIEGPQDLRPPQGLGQGLEGVDFPPELEGLLIPRKAAELSRIPVPDDATKAKFAEFVDEPLGAENVLYVLAGRPRILPLKQPPVRVQIGDEQIADFQFIDPDDLQLFGNSSGRTILNLWFRRLDANGNPVDSDPVLLSYVIQVLPETIAGQKIADVYEQLEVELNEAFPRAEVRIRPVGPRVIVSGQVPDQFTANQILSLVGGITQTFQRGNRFNQGQFQDAESVRLVVGVNGNLEQAPDQLTNILRQTNQNQNNFLLVNLLEIVGEQQIQLRVTLAEVNRSALRAVGADFSLTGSNGVSFITQILAPPGGGQFIVDRQDFDLTLGALRTLGLSRTLAEPNLVTLNGQTANFQSGTQFAVSNLGGGQGVVLQGFDQVFAGIGLNFRPEIVDRDRIRIVVTATSSALAGTTPIGPNISERTVETVVELREHQTMAIAGLLQNTLTEASQSVPLLGDIPYLKRLFSTESVDYSEQELLIILTPSLVRPLEEHEVPSLPGETITEPGDLEFFLQGRLEGRRKYDFRSSARTSWDRLKAYHHCESCVLIGPTGHTDGPLRLNEFPVTGAVQHAGREYRPAEKSAAVVSLTNLGVRSASGESSDTERENGATRKLETNGDEASDPLQPVPSKHRFEPTVAPLRSADETTESDITFEDFSIPQIIDRRDGKRSDAVIPVMSTLQRNNKSSAGE